MSTSDIQSNATNDLNAGDIKQIAGSFKAIAIAIALLMSILLAGIVQYGYAQERRLGVHGSDIENYSISFSDNTYSDVYYIREFIYYFPGKLLTELFGDAYTVLNIYDYICIGAILLNYSALRDNPFYVLSVMISPLFMTGFTNIHRQLIATVVYIVLDSRIDRNSICKRLCLGAFCIFIHNYIAVVAAIEIQILLLMLKKRTQAAAFSIVVVLLLYMNLGNYDKPEVASTSALTYTAWCAALLVIGIVIDRINSYKLDWFRHAAFIALIVVSNMLFAINSGAAGGRLLLGGTTIYLFRTLFPGAETHLQRKREHSGIVSSGSVSAFFLKPLLCVAMVTPVFFNRSTVVVMLLSLNKIREVM